MGHARAVIVGKTSVDWLTLTTYEASIYAAWRETICSTCKMITAKSQKRMQYSGEGGEGFFYGVGRQSGKPHYMVQVSGAEADAFMKSVLPFFDLELISCSRIDVQFTLAREGYEEKLSDVGRTLRALVKSGTGRRGQAPEIVCYDGDRPYTDTLYVGTRRSDRFLRVYDKWIDEQPFIRMEAEYKGNLASAAFRRYVKGETELERILKAAPPPIAYNLELFDRFARAIGDVESEPSYFLIRERDDERTLEWLDDAVFPALQRLALDGHRDAVNAFLQKVLSDDIILPAES
jgi:hypothetical protein